MRHIPCTGQQAGMIRSVFSELESYYGVYEWWPGNNPYEVMLGAVLVQNTNWRNAAKALDNLGETLVPELIEQMELDSLAQSIRPSGYYNQKALRLKALTHWYAGYGYDIEAVRQASMEYLRPELLAIKGIGGETADVILTYAIKKPSFVIDAYARRIFSRFGLSVPKSYEAFRSLMSEALADKTSDYGYYHGLMVDHGQQFCRKRPDCEACPLRLSCQRLVE